MESNEPNEPRFSIEQELGAIRTNYAHYLKLAKDPKANHLPATKSGLSSFIESAYEKLSELKRERTDSADKAELRRELPDLFSQLLRLKSILAHLPTQAEPEPWGGKTWAKRAKTRLLEKGGIDPTSGQAITEGGIGGK